MTKMLTRVLLLPPDLRNFALKNRIFLSEALAFDTSLGDSFPYQKLTLISNLGFSHTYVKLSEEIVKLQSPKGYPFPKIPIFKL